MQVGDAIRVNESKRPAGPGGSSNLDSGSQPLDLDFDLGVSALPVDAASARGSEASA
jgi:hypothetical protein